MLNIPGLIVKSDPSNDNNINCSSYIIRSSLNSALKQEGLYDENGKVVVYDILGNSHGHNPDAFISAYELTPPPIILQNMFPKPVLGLSKDNFLLYEQAGYPSNLLNWFKLGVDSEKWRYIYKNKENEKPTILLCGESNTRGGLELGINGFCNIFKDNQTVRLYIRDRSSSETFKSWIKNKASESNVDIIHDDRELFNIEDELEIYSKVDFALMMNKTSTWNMRMTEMMAAGLPIIATNFQGHREYLCHGFSGIECEFDFHRITEEKIDELKSIGLRNHLFPINMHINPIWSIPRDESLKSNILELLENKNLRDKISHGARIMAEKLTWNRSVRELVSCLKDFNIYE